MTDFRRGEGSFKKMDPDKAMHTNKELLCILGIPGSGKTSLCKYFSLNILKGVFEKHEFSTYIELKVLC